MSDCAIKSELALFLYSERELFMAVRNYLNEEANKRRKSKKGKMKKSDDDEFFARGIQAANYLLAAIKRENFSFKKNARKFHEEFIVFANVEDEMMNHGLEFELESLPKEIPGVLKNNALLEYLKAMSYEIDSQLDIFDKSVYPRRFCMFSDAFEATKDLYLAFEHKEYNLANREAFINDFFCIARAAEEFQHLEVMCSAFDCMDAILRQRRV